MADFIKVDSAGVNIAAAKIEGYNIKIKNDFSAAESAVRALSNAWSGTAAGCAIGAFHSIKSTYYDSRYAVMDSFAQFLRQVEAGYTQTEARVHLNALKFK